MFQSILALLSDAAFGAFIQGIGVIVLVGTWRAAKEAEHRLTRIETKVEAIERRLDHPKN